MNIINFISKLPRKGNQDSQHTVGSITKIVVHHDAQFRPDAYDDLTRYSQQANFHISRGEDGLQYHYKISNLGDVYLCRNLEDTLWHCGNYRINRSSIAVCLDGNFQDQQPTPQQLDALQKLLDHLCTEHPEFPADRDDVFYHGEISSTACCGNNLKNYVSSYRNGKNIVNGPVTVETPKPQDPPKTGYWKVYDFNGTQVGAYSSRENAQKKLDTMEAGQLKSPEGTVIVDKKKQAPVVVPPFKEEIKPVATPPVVPTAPVITPPAQVLPIEEKKEYIPPSQEVLDEQQALSFLTKLFRPIYKFYIKLKERLKNEG